jgi:WD40 repeat protein
MQLWNVSTHQPADPPLPSHQGPVVDVKFSPDGRHIASMSYLVGGNGGNPTDGMQLRVTDSSTGRPIVDGPTEIGYGGYSLAFSPDGRRVAIGGSDGKIRVRDADTAAAVGPPLSGHTGPVNTVVYSPDGSKILSAGDNTIHVWAADPEQSIGTRLPGLAFDGSLPAAVSPDGSLVATRDVNKQSDIALWRIDTGKLVRTIPTGYVGPVSALAWRPDGEAISSAAGSADTVQIWDAQTGEPDGPTLSGPTNGIHKLAFSADGQRLAGLVVDSAPWLWDLSTNPPRATVLRGEEGYVTTTGFSADGHRLITLAPTHFASPDDGTVLATGNVFDSPDMTPSAVRVWDTDTGEPAGPPVLGRGGRMTDLMNLAETDNEQPISAAAISPDGQHILVAAVKGLRLYDVAISRPVGEPWKTSPSGSVTIGSLAFSPDGTSVVSADMRTRQLQLWDAESGRPIGNPLIGHTGGVLGGLAFTTDGNHIVSQGQDGWMLWPAPNSWRDELCKKLTSNMTRTEWDDWVSPTIEYKAACPKLDVP